MRIKPLFLLCTCAIAGVFAVLAVRVFTFELEAYRTSLKGESGVNLVAAALAAMERVSMERAPSNGIIGEPRSDQRALLESLARARSASDVAIGRLQSLLESDPTERHQAVLKHLSATVRQLQTGRANVDALARLPAEQRRPQAIRAAVHSMILVVSALGPVVIDLNSEAERADPSLSSPLSVAYLAAELREQAGQFGSQITASLATRRRLDDAETEDLDRTRGQIEALSALLGQRLQPYLDDPRVRRAAGRIDAEYARQGLAFVERIIESGKRSGDYGITTSEFAAQYVPQMASIPDLRDLILEVAREKARSTRAEARAFLAAAAAGYILLLAILAVMLLYLGRRVMRAFATTTEVIVSIAEGKLDTPVETTPRRDEIGKMLRSIQILKEGMIRQRQMEIALRLSEERFRLAMHHSAIGMAMLGQEGRWFDVNPALCRILGRSREAILSAGALSLVHPDDQEEAQACIQGLLSGKMAAYESEWRFLHKDGHIVWTQLNVSLIRDGEGKPHYFFSQIQDISDRRRAAEVVSRLAAIVESSDDAIIGKTLEGIILTWNSGAERLYGYSKEEAVGSRVSLLMPQGHEDDTSMILERIRRGERVEHYETTRRRKDGVLVHISLTVSPIKDPAGRITGASAIARNVTERRMAEEEREKLIAELQDALSNVKTLRGLIPICASCKKIRDDRGYWNQIESYLKKHSEADFSHGICPECLHRLYPDIWEKISKTDAEAESC